MKKLISCFGLLLLLASHVPMPVHAQQNQASSGTPNIVLILVDDAGLMDFSSFGGEAKTPNIDRLANEGVVFTGMRASPVCAPSRAMLLTGSDSHLTGVANLPEMLPESFQDAPGYAGVLNDRVQTIATRLKEVNYNTYTTGKWHLGHDETTLPTSRGFDRAFILDGSGASNYSHHGYLPMKPEGNWYADGEKTEVPEDFYSSKTYIDQIISFHEEETEKNNPFFSYIAFQAIHAPIQAPKEFVEPYKETSAVGWDVLRQNRFEKAKEIGLIPSDAALGDVFADFKKWDELTEDAKASYVINMAVTAGMLEAMDYHIGRYVEYLTKAGLIENTIFIVTSDNGPDGADYSSGLAWARQHGYHTNFDQEGAERFYGYLGPEWANAVASPFSYFKYYTGEGGIRVPFIISGNTIPQNQRTDEFAFFTDVAPTIYDLVGISTKANEGYAPITGKSMLPHIKDSEQSIYGPGEGVGLEAANSSAYFQDGYKIVKNNIPFGDNQWYLYNIEKDPGETTDLAAQEPQRFQRMLSAYQAYAKEVGVIEMPPGYSAEGTVNKKSLIHIIHNLLPYIVGGIVIVLSLIGFLVWRVRRKTN